MRLALPLLLVACGGGEPDREPVDPSTTPPTTTTTATSFTLHGRVVDDDGAPVADAMVLFGGRPETMVTSGPDGSFAIAFTPVGYGEPAIVAAKPGYRSVGDEFFDAESFVELQLRRVSEVDNLDYVFQDPGDGVDAMQENCSHCHTTFVADFLSSAHAEAARNPLVQDLYAGVAGGRDQAACAAAGGRWEVGHEPGTEAGQIAKCYLGGGVLPDLNPQCGGPGDPPCDAAGATAPTAFGACADCHAPGIDGVAGGRDLHDAWGLAYDKGVHCDVCHKVRDVEPSLPPGVGGRLVLGRPSEPGRNAMFAWDPVYYGPLIDVPNIVMGGSWQPEFELAVFCSGCHQQEQAALVPGTQLAPRWPNGLPVHTTYAEWQAGPYNRDATQCQFCHMPADPDRNNAVDVSTRERSSITFGFPREPEDVRRHLFRSPLQGSPRLIDGAVYVSLALSVDAGELVVDTSLTNIGCGHAVPTGEPMRALVLVVEADGACGELDAVGGMTVPDTGGALASGVVEADLTVAGDVVTWPGHGLSVGAVLRAVRPSGAWDDYVATGAFAGFTPVEKGMPILDPVAEVTVVAVAGDQLTTSEALAVQAGDTVFAGAPWAGAVDGQAATALAGHAGYAFAKVLTDPTGERHVPHYRAVDVASDNRIGPGDSARTTHRFALPPACQGVEARATLLYRPVPLSLAEERGWTSQDHVIATATATL